MPSRIGRNSSAGGATGSAKERERIAFVEPGDVAPAHLGFALKQEAGVAVVFAGATTIAVRCNLS
jgi:hypothetical protein